MWMWMHGWQIPVEVLKEFQQSLSQKLFKETESENKEDHPHIADELFETESLSKRLGRVRVVAAGHWWILVKAWVGTRAVQHICKQTEGRDEQ